MKLHKDRPPQPWSALRVASTLAAALGGGVLPLYAAPDVRINSITAETQAEAQIVVSPTNPMNLFAAWRDLRAGRAAIGHAYSMDGGVTWTLAVYGDPAAA